MPCSSHEASGIKLKREQEHETTVIPGTRSSGPGIFNVGIFSVLVVVAGSGDAMTRTVATDCCVPRQKSSKP